MLSMSTVRPHFQQSRHHGQRTTSCHKFCEVRNQPIGQIFKLVKVANVLVAETLQPSHLPPNFLESFIFRLFDDAMLTPLIANSDSTFTTLNHVLLTEWIVPRVNSSSKHVSRIRPGTNCPFRTRRLHGHQTLRAWSHYDQACGYDSASFDR